jgi:hypothetical protein
VDLNRKRNAYAKVIQALNTIPKRGKVMFSDKCVVYRSGQSETVVYWSKENLNYFEELERSPPHVVIWAGVESKRLLLAYLLHGALSFLRS